MIERKKAESVGSLGEKARRVEELNQINEDIEATFKMTTARVEARVAELEGQLADSNPAIRELEQVREGLLDFQAQR